MQRSANVRKYVREYEFTLEERPMDQIKRRILGLNVVIKRARDYKVNDIRRYVK